MNRSTLLRLIASVPFIGTALVKHRPVQVLGTITSDPPFGKVVIGFDPATNPSGSVVLLMVDHVSSIPPPGWNGYARRGGVSLFYRVEHRA